jgi:hypothetical protein
MPLITLICTEIVVLYFCVQEAERRQARLKSEADAGHGNEGQWSPARDG